MTAHTSENLRPGTTLYRVAELERQLAEALALIAELEAQQARARERCISTWSGCRRALAPSGGDLRS
jgi:hypothetical protein